MSEIHSFIYCSSVQAFAFQLHQERSETAQFSVVMFSFCAIFLWTKYGVTQHSFNGKMLTKNKVLRNDKGKEKKRFDISKILIAFSDRLCQIDRWKSVKLPIEFQMRKPKTARKTLQMNLYNDRFGVMWCGGVRHDLVHSHVRSICI